MPLRFEELFSERCTYTHFPTLVREVTASADIGDLLALTDGNESAFGTRRAFSEAVGVGESTIAGWIKEAKMPPLAKAVVGLLHVSLELQKTAIEHERESWNLGDMIVRDGDGYMIVNFGAHGSMGEIAARNIPDKETASRLVSHRELRNALKLVIGEISASAGTRRAVSDDLLAYLENLAHDVNDKAPPQGTELGDELKEMAETSPTEEADIEGGDRHA